eukprot:1275993-Prymnesium_polylepis.1
MHERGSGRGTFAFAPSVGTMLLTLPSVATAAALLGCADGGPWACTVEGCPTPQVDCAALADLGFCATRFEEIWDPAPPGTAAAVVRERCPHACGRCGVTAPSACNMLTFDVDAVDDDEAAL